MNEDVAVVIPARFASTRFPGKPLAKICGKYLVQHCWEQACKAIDQNFVYIATDDSRIANAAERFGAQVIMTSNKCLTGTDRVAEANRSLQKDCVINIQGDEPLIRPEDIIKVLVKFKECKASIVNAYCEMQTWEDPSNLSIPKVVFSSAKKLLYISRNAIPISKSGVTMTAYKQVCIYAFSASQLEFFSSFDRKGPLEKIEDIEILRFLEYGYDVQMVEVDHGSVAVDNPEDVAIVERIIGCAN